MPCKNDKENSNQPKFSQLDDNYRPTIQEYERFMRKLSDKPPTEKCIFYLDDAIDAIKIDSTNSNEKTKKIKQRIRFSFRKRKIEPRRLMFIWFSGRLPCTTKLIVNMQCGNKECINPLHMKELFEPQKRVRSKNSVMKDDEYMDYGSDIDSSVSSPPLSPEAGI